VRRCGVCGVVEVSRVVEVSGVVEMFIVVEVSVVTLSPVTSGRLGGFDA